MKKLTLTIVTSLAMTGAALAQGSISWSGPSAASFTAQTNNITYSPLGLLGVTGPTGLAGATNGATATTALGFYYELLYNGVNTTGVASTIPDIASLLAWTDGNLTATNNIVTAGRAVVENSNIGTVVPWATPGISNNIVLVGWSSNLGTTWAAARTALSDWSTTQIPNAFLGISHTGFITPLASSVSPGTVVFGNANIAQGMPIGNSLLTQLYILPVPEPSTMALAGLGALSLMLFRRKNK